MIRSEQLFLVIAQQGMTVDQVAWHLGMSPRCFRRKLQSRNFGSAEIQDLVELLELKHPERIFFS